ncbi:MAG TPA: type II secretion system minor pseudopilin GspH [Steroidobacteraceae bacterium]|nr:type II secretion system minor pseudopilin GspH [Steroidobacteraceae bacterium]
MKRRIRASRPAQRGGGPETRFLPAARRPGRRALSRAHASGFTLLEILVVVLIIGIVTAGMLLSMSFAGKDTDLETESKRLLSLMKYARDQAELQTRDYGVFFSQHGYEFVVYDARRGLWRRVFEDDALRERTLPSGLDFKLVVDARPIVLGESMEVPASSASDSEPGSGSHPAPAPRASADSNSDAGSDSDSDSDSDFNRKSFAPQVMIFSSGDLSSFKITLERAAAGRSITLDENQDGEIVEKPMAEGGT